MKKMSLFSFLTAGLLAVIALSLLSIPQIINADLKHLTTELSHSVLIENGHLTICKMDASSYEVVKTIKMVLTAYSSTPDQTDDTPFITASGKHVIDGIIASNILPFGTKVRINGKIYTVEDRMNKIFNGKNRADIWLATRAQATQFGVKVANVEIIES